MENRDSDIAALRDRVLAMAGYLRMDAKRLELAALDERASEPGFWDDQGAAQRAMAQAAAFRDEIESYEAMIAALEDVEAANELAMAEEDEELAAELAGGLSSLVGRITELEVASWFTEELDPGDAIITITPGQGGLEAQDWTEMLLKMYSKYAERKKWKIDLHDAPVGVELGLDRAVFTVHGRNAYGMLRSEMGVHRLVRISPTDEKKRRQTTFAGVEVLPVLPDEIEVDVRDEDLRIDVYRSSGPGGQSVNTTDSAVRITHLLSGIVVTVQNEKSQHKNKEAAMKILRSRLYELEKEKREAELEELRGPRKEITFGSQIRNYVLYPYQLVKDLRTGHETGNVEAVLGGDIEAFLIAFLRWRVGGDESAQAQGQTQTQAQAQAQEQARAQAQASAQTQTQAQAQGPGAV